MAKVPHHAGSPASAAVPSMRWIVQEFGLEAHIEHFEAMLLIPPLARSKWSAP